MAASTEAEEKNALDGDGDGATAVAAAIPPAVSAIPASAAFAATPATAAATTAAAADGDGGGSLSENHGVGADSADDSSSRVPTITIQDAFILPSCKMYRLAVEVTLPSALLRSMLGTSVRFIFQLKLLFLIFCVIFRFSFSYCQTFWVIFTTIILRSTIILVMVLFFFFFLYWSTFMVIFLLL